MIIRNRIKRCKESDYFLVRAFPWSCSSIKRRRFSSTTLSLPDTRFRGNPPLPPHGSSCQVNSAGRDTSAAEHATSSAINTSEVARLCRPTLMNTCHIACSCTTRQCGDVSWKESEGSGISTARRTKPQTPGVRRHGRRD